MDFSSKKSLRGTLTLVLVVSVALHLLALFVFGAVKIAQVVMRDEVAFVSPPPLPLAEEIPEFEVNLEQRNQESAPPRPNPIVVDSPDIALPALDIDVNVESTSSYGRGSGSGDFGSGSGTSQIREMSIDLTKFGYSGFVEGTLEGILFDLKNDKNGRALINYDRQSAKLEPEVGLYAQKVISEFANGSWNLSGLESSFKQAKKKLYSSYFVIPNGDASDAPKAFEAEREIEAKAILAVYTGTFVPSESGRFRFAGKADDAMIVRVRNKIVLDGSVNNGYSSWDQSKAEKGTVHFGMQARPFIYGDWITLSAGTPTKIDILVAEAPGGLFAAYLLLEKEGGGLRIFSTKDLTSEEKTQIRNLHPDSNRFL
ncbi:MAG: hypothetical protein AAF065_12390 [Verrucomicrobiota bacterium]